MNFPPALQFGVWISGILLALLSPCRGDGNDPWNSQDIGNVGDNGSSTYDNFANTLTIKGGGSDIWDAADSLRYVYQKLDGDVDLSAHLLSMDNTNEWARVGIMIRKDNTASAMYGMMLQTDLQGEHFAFRTMDSGNCNETDVNNNGAPTWLRLVRVGNVVAGYDSTDGLHWDCRGAVRLAFEGTVEVGLGVCAHDGGDPLCAANFEHLNLQMGNPLAPPQPWAEEDVGATPVAGGVLWEKNECDLFASGRDIWDNLDAGHFLYQPLNGDGYVVVHVGGIMNTDSSAKAGIMFRESKSGDSREVSLLLMPDSGICFFRRVQPGASANTTGISAKAPLWLEMTRKGDVFSAFTSVDGQNWKLLGKDTVAMTPELQYGLILSPRKMDGLGEASFDHVAIGLGEPGPGL
jgi:regulation of enolase protein 1 (concanavalin A-like superfamily)